MPEENQGLYDHPEKDRGHSENQNAEENEGQNGLRNSTNKSVGEKDLDEERTSTESSHKPGQESKPTNHEHPDERSPNENQNRDEENNRKNLDDRGEDEGDDDDETEDVSEDEDQINDENP